MAETRVIKPTPQPQRRDDRRQPPRPRPTDKREDRIRDYVRESYDQLPIPDVPDNPKDE
jgi:hypothetical protein